LGSTHFFRKRSYESIPLLLLLLLFLFSILRVQHMATKLTLRGSRICNQILVPQNAPITWTHLAASFFLSLGYQISLRFLFFSFSPKCTKSGWSSLLDELLSSWWMDWSLILWLCLVALHLIHGYDSHVAHIAQDIIEVVQSHITCLWGLHITNKVFFVVMVSFFRHP